MFGLKWWRNRRRNKKRLLFHFWDGEKIRRADPFRLWRDLQNDPTVELDAAIPASERGDEPETTQLIEAVAKAFGVERWNGENETGLADWEILDLMGYLSVYLDELKKKYSPGLTSPPPMVSQSSIGQPAPDVGTTLSSDSPSTPSVKILDANIPPPAPPATASQA